MPIRATLAAALVALVLTEAAQGDSDDPVVVELYTSQGCNTCPPADAYLGELAERDDVIALSLHVDYWDYIGWKDPFAMPGNTSRQRRYSDVFGTGYVYTPQMVVDGRGHNSNPERVEALIQEARTAGDRLDVRIERDASGRMWAAIPARAGTAEATVWAAVYDDKHTTEIERGENAGHTLSYHNVVREMVELGSYDGTAIRLPLPDAREAASAGRDGCAVVVQAAGQGPVLGAAKAELVRSN